MPAINTPEELAAAKLRLAALIIARDSGVLNVKHGEESVTYRSLSELLKAIDLLRREIAAAEGTLKRGPRYIIEKDKGL